MDRITKLFAAATLVVLALCACSTGQSSKINAFEEIASFAAGSNVSWSASPTSVIGVLPNTTYVLYGEDNVVIVSAPLSDLVVTGHFTSSKVYSSTIWNEDDSSTTVGAHQSADSRILHLEFATSEVIAAGDGIEHTDTFTVALRVPGDKDPNAIGQDLIEIGDTVLFLEEEYPTNNTGAWTIALQGSMIGKLSANGDIVFPALSHLEAIGESGPFGGVDDKTTLSVLKEAATQPDVEVSS